MSTSAGEKGVLEEADTLGKGASQNIENIDAVHVISNDPEDPMNWPELKKWGVLITVVYASFLANYMAGAHNTAFVNISTYYGVTVGDAANTVGYGILGLGIGPLLWTALGRSLGRRPTYIISSFCFFACAIWLSFAKTFTAFVAARFFAGFFGSASLSVGSYTIADMFPKEVRGTKVSLWTTAIVVGPVLGPFIAGFIVYTQKWQVIYYVITAQAFVVFVCFIFFAPETLYTRRAITPFSAHPTHPQNAPDSESQPLEDDTVKVEGTRGPAYYPWRQPKAFLLQFLKPFVMCRYITILIPSIWYAVAFGWSVGTTIVLPQILETPVAKGGYGWETRQVGCAFLASAGGSILGKWSGGHVSDWVMTRVSARHGGVREPEYRLWATVIIIPFLPLGMLMFGAGINYHLHYMVAIMGGFFYFFGITGSTTIVGTYVIDSYVSEAAAGSTVLNFIKFMFAFSVPFFIVQWATETSYLKAYIVQAVITGPVGAIMVAFFLWKGRRIRLWQGMPDHAVAIVT